jgi:acetyltransferase-like isoleucine patch superfamily enzyme
MTETSLTHHQIFHIRTVTASSFSFRALLKRLYKEYLYSRASLRSWVLKLRLKKAGDAIYIMRGCSFLSPENISLGSSVSINHDCEIDAAGGEITIGDNVMIGQNSKLITPDHEYENNSMPMMYGLRQMRQYWVE